MFCCLISNLSDIFESYKLQKFVKKYQIASMNSNDNNNNNVSQKDRLNNNNNAQENMNEMQRYYQQYIELTNIMYDIIDSKFLILLQQIEDSLVTIQINAQVILCFFY